MTTTTAHPPTFNRWLKRRRAQVDLTQEALAELAFCSVQAIRSFETGRRRPSLEMAERLADVLRVPTDQHAAFIRLARAVVTTDDDESEATPALPAVTTTALMPCGIRNRRAFCSPIAFIV